jgi:hypothetical protein
MGARGVADPRKLEYKIFRVAFEDSSSGSFVEKR